MSNELDKQFGDRLTGYESEIDAEALWQTVKPPRRRRPFAWIWFALVGIALSVGTAWWMYPSTAETANVVDSTEANTATWVEETHQLSLESTTDLSQSDGQPQEPQRENTSVPILNTSSITQASTGTENQFSETTHIDNTISIVSSEVVKETTISNFVTSVEEPLPILSDETMSTSAQSLGNTTSPELSLLETQNYSQSFIERSSAQIVNAIPTLSTVPIQGAEDNDDQSINGLAAVPTPLKSSPWFTQIEAGYFMLHRKLEQNDSFASRGWLRSRLETESLLEATSLDVTVGYHFNKKWELRSGLGYTQINTAFNYTDTQINIDTILGPAVIVYGANNEADTIYSLVPRTTTSNYRKRIYNSFRQWEVPLIAAYNFGNGKLHFQAEAGVRLQLSRHWEGQIMGEGGEAFIPLEGVDWYRSALDISFQAGLKANYELTSRTSIIAGFSGRYSPQAFTKSNAPFLENYQLLGVNIGLRHKF